MKEKEFEKMVRWISRPETFIEKMIEENKITSEKAFENVLFTSEITSLFALLDASPMILDKSLQINGIRLLRKIIEVENPTSYEPAADWDADDMEPYRKKIKA